MEHVSIADGEPVPSGDGVDRRTLSDALGTSNLAVNRYVVDPGERVSGLHAHLDQEEVFVVLDGEVTFETYAPPRGATRASGETASADGRVRVAEGEAIRFAPGEFQSGRNDAGEPATVLALGAPRESEAVRVPVACPACGHGATRPDLADGGPVLVCPDCGGESAVECPACGGQNVRAELDDAGPVSVCQDCGETFDP